LQDPLLARPAFIFASAAADDPDPGNSKSRRPQETVTPLAQLLNLDLNLNFSKGQETELVAAAQQCSGPVLIAWQHETINAIANAILGDNSAPQDWPGSHRASNGAPLSRRLGRSDLEALATRTIHRYPCPLIAGCDRRFRTKFYPRLQRA
jgi:hypothetical protein